MPVRAWLAAQNFRFSLGASDTEEDNEKDCSVTMLVKRIYVTH